MPRGRKKAADAAAELDAPAIATEPAQADAPEAKGEGGEVATSVAETPEPPPAERGAPAIATEPAQAVAPKAIGEGGEAATPVAETPEAPPAEQARSEPTVAELREATQEILERSEPASESLPQRERFRGWVTDNARGYARWSDGEYQRIILQFNERPSPDILAAVKDAGFHFQPDYCGFKNAWVRRNDYTGRVQVDAIEKLVRAKSVGQESPAIQ